MTTAAQADAKTYPPSAETVARAHVDADKYTDVRSLDQRPRSVLG